MGGLALSTDREALDSYGGNRFNPSYKGFAFCKRIEFVGGVPVYLDTARRAGEDSGRRLRGGDEAGETARRGGAATRQGWAKQRTEVKANGNRRTRRTMRVMGRGTGWEATRTGRDAGVEVGGNADEGGGQTRRTNKAGDEAGGNCRNLSMKGK